VWATQKKTWERELEKETCKTGLTNSWCRKLKTKAEDGITASVYRGQWQDALFTSGRSEAYVALAATRHRVKKVTTVAIYYCHCMQVAMN